MTRQPEIQRWFLIAAVIAASVTSGNGQSYDLLLKGGHVIDPKNEVDGMFDVAIRGDRIAAVAEDIPAEQAETVIAVSGLYVTPGLVDIHAHFYTYSDPGTVYGGSSSVDPDATCPRTCVTSNSHFGISVPILRFSRLMGDCFWGSRS